MKADEFCIACANGNDLEDGDECAACGRGAAASEEKPSVVEEDALTRAIRTARGGREPPVPKRAFA